MRGRGQRRRLEREFTQRAILEAAALLPVPDDPAARTSLIWRYDTDLGIRASCIKEAPTILGVQNGVAEAAEHRRLPPTRCATSGEQICEKKSRSPHVPPRPLLRDSTIGSSDARTAIPVVSPPHDRSDLHTSDRWHGDPLLAALRLRGGGRDSRPGLRFPRRLHPASCCLDSAHWLRRSYSALSSSLRRYR